MNRVCFAVPSPTGRLIPLPRYFGRVHAEWAVLRNFIAEDWTSRPRITVCFVSEQKR